MLSAKETLIVLEKYFDECVAFWKRRGFDDKRHLNCLSLTLKLFEMIHSLHEDEHYIQEQNMNLFTVKS